MSNATKTEGFTGSVRDFDEAIFDLLTATLKELWNGYDDDTRNEMFIYAQEHGVESAAVEVNTWA